MYNSPATRGHVKRMELAKLKQNPHLKETGVQALANQIAMPA